ncbi:lasso peptide biosynthesis B2 protein [Sandaracinobacter neustonicus]|uniref:Lasso peptide biosynthesis B2 protein n=1 Tax=Sandaracinobacter neustonicus TaxID=1715348 RepID=A0A501XH63_9SPHN|nr:MULTISPECIES: lasso peptide biosynthesis B2 protein [Alphaproteobacteria]TPE59759.1 lasso peptide biosynthesis B2 protein [Sandaracinobacter neustonicus]
MYRLRNGIHAALVDGRSVLLDIPKDRYFLVPDSVNDVLGNLDRGHDISPSQQQRLGSLVRSGVLVASPGGHNRRIYTKPTAEPAAEAPQRQHTNRLLAAALFQHARTSIRLRLSSIDAILDNLRSRKKRLIESGKFASAHAVYERASAFRSSSKFYPNDHRCLRRSIAFMDDLLRHGHVADLVVGVQLSPFSAHCWVQQGETVLNDGIEDVQPYTSILVI